MAVYRALGYGAAVLEGGLGFLQFFWSDNRMCAQDRLAETVVIDERRRKAQRPVAVSYTHLDVYKRQPPAGWAMRSRI